MLFGFDSKSGTKIREILVLARGIMRKFNIYGKNMSHPINKKAALLPHCFKVDIS